MISPSLRNKSNKYCWIFIVIAGVFIASPLVILPIPLFKSPLSTAVVDEEGQLLGARIATDGQWRFGAGKTVPQKFVCALLNYEDRHFYQHPGVDVKSMGAAILSQMSSGNKKRGGSTITMQVMRLALENHHRTIFSKIQEIAGAMVLEFSHSKEEILQYYLNNAPFGGNIVGIEAACWRYFGKNASDLSWAEAAMLAVLPNQPSMIHISKNRPILKSKRDRLLNKLYALHIIDEVTLSLSLDEPLPEKPLPLPTLAGHLVDHLTFNKRMTGIHTTSLNPDLQLLALNVATKYNDIYKEDQIEHIAVLILDNQSNKVLAYIGNTKSSPIDMIMAKRSSGSILKPLLYMAALDDGIIYPTSLLSDIPIAINGYSPANFDRDFRGAIGADEALQRSLNIPYVLLLRKYGISKFLNKLHKAGITTFHKSADHYGLSLILGGGEASLWEMSNVYASISRLANEYVENGGKYRNQFYHSASFLPPYLTFGKMPLSKTAPVFSAGAAFACAETLKKLGRPDEEGLWEEFSSQHPLAWKTGTSFGHKDAWAIGFDKKYTIGIWVGNASGVARSNLTGIHRAAPVLFDIYNQLPNTSWFDAPWDDLRKIQICSQSGLKAKDQCPKKVEQYVPHSSLKNEMCAYHQVAMISSFTGKRLMKECTGPTSYTIDTFFVIPPAEAAFYARHHSDFKELPPLEDDCISAGIGDGKPNFSLIYPSENTRMYLPNNIAGQRQAMVFKAHHYDPSAKLYWYLDGKYLGSTMEFHSMEIQSTKGKHLLTLTDASGAEVVRKFELIER
ncbi:MAG: penicillin-binding protein 1C [Saprospiraceae bacterium]